METLEVINPATGEKIGEVQETPIKESENLMRQARQAFPNWSQTPLEKRLHYLGALRHLLIEQMDECIGVIAKNTGKPKVEAITAEILTVVDAIVHMEKHAKQILRSRKVKTPLTLIGKQSYVSYQPRGVVLVISPWNYPFQLAMIPALSALVAGNTVILKPSEVTPLVGQWIETAFEQAGFPKDVIQVAQGGGELGAKLIETSPDYIFFTGSVRTGKIIQQEAAKRLIPTTLELGGKDPMIVFQDANLDRAAKGAVWGALTNSGQVCMSVERIYVEETILEPFLAKLKKEVTSLQQELNDEADLGSMTFASQREIVRQHIEDALQSGARIAYGSKPDNWPEQKSLHLPPIILTDVTHTMKVMQEETFGPVISVHPFADEQEAIRLANDSPFGLNASVWSRDIEKARRVANRLQSGSVVINDVIVSVANPYLPFGGVKESGIGRYHGDIGLQIFCHEKAILIEKGRKKTEVNWFPYAGKLPLFRRLITSFYGKKRSLWGFVSAYLKLLRKSR